MSHVSTMTSQSGLISTQSHFSRIDRSSSLTWPALCWVTLPATCRCRHAWLCGRWHLPAFREHAANSCYKYAAMLCVGTTDEVQRTRASIFIVVETIHICARLWPWSQQKHHLVPRLSPCIQASRYIYATLCFWSEQRNACFTAMLCKQSLEVSRMICTDVYCTYIHVRLWA